MLKSLEAAAVQLGIDLHSPDFRMLMVTPRRTFAYDKIEELRELIPCELYLDAKFANVPLTHCPRLVCQVNSSPFD